MPDLRICFAGTPDFAAEHLSSLIQHNHNIVCVYTQPDRPSGRGKRLHGSPVKQLAIDHDIQVRQPPSLKDESAQQSFRELDVDLLIVVAYGLILPKPILETPKLGCINVHASLLPRWRGAAPIERALLAGDKETGVTIMLMDEGLDTGPMLYKQTVSIEASDDRESLTTKLTESGQRALIHTLEDLTALLAAKQVQDDSLSTYAAKLDKSEAAINWHSPAEDIDRLVRASVGRNPAYSELGTERVRVISSSVIAATVHVPPGTILGVEKDGIDVACLESVLRIRKLQLPGKKPWSSADLINSRNPLVVAGKLFSSTHAAQ